MSRKSRCEQHHDAILSMNNEGLERAVIAQRLGLSTYSVQAYLQRRKIRMQRSTWGKRPTLQREEVQRLVEVEHLTYSKIASILGCHETSVERLASKMGLQTARTGPRAGSGHQQKWSGGRHLAKGWYIDVFVPLHPNAKRTGYYPEHRLVVEVSLGRYLLATEVVDHRDNHPQHNWPDNLRLFSSNADHLRATLTGLPKCSQVRLILGDWQSNRKTARCPEQTDTLAQATSETRFAIEQHILIHQPTTEHCLLTKKMLLRRGPWSSPFQPTSTEKCIGSQPSKDVPETSCRRRETLAA